MRTQAQHQRNKPTGIGRILTTGILTAGALTLCNGAQAAAKPRNATKPPSSTKLFLNGKVASTQVQTVNGQAVVSLQDLARALGMVVVKNANGDYEITKAGGTTQIQGLNGKIGDVLFDGKWRFKVSGVSTPVSYTLKTGADLGEGYYAGGLVKWNGTTRTLLPETGHRLVVLQCQAINAVAQKRSLWIADNNTNTALADADGESHPAVVHDFGGAPIQSKPLLQGAKLDFNLVFSVPQGTQMKDLVFTLVANGDIENARDTRISLTETDAPSALPDASAPKTENGNSTTGRVER